MPVAVSPCLLVAVFPAGRKQLIEHFGKIPVQPRFEFDCPQRPGTADVKYVCRSVRDLGPGHNLLHLRGDVVNIPMPAGIDVNFVLVDHSIVQVCE